MNVLLPFGCLYVSLCPNYCMLIQCEMMVIFMYSKKLSGYADS